MQPWGAHKQHALHGEQASWVFPAGGGILKDMAAAFAAVPALVLWRLSDKEQAELAKPGFPALSANVKARACMGP